MLYPTSPPIFTKRTLSSHYFSIISSPFLPKDHYDLPMIFTKQAPLFSPKSWSNGHLCDILPWSSHHIPIILPYVHDFPIIFATAGYSAHGLGRAVDDPEDPWPLVPRPAPSTLSPSFKRWKIGEAYAISKRRFLNGMVFVWENPMKIWMS